LDRNRRNKPDVALGYVEKAIAMDPRVPDYFVTRADCYRIMQRTELALADYHRVYAYYHDFWLPCASSCCVVLISVLFVVDLGNITREQKRFAPRCCTCSTVIGSS
jgi:tetratricopeptide (TPR) repeat protein